MIRFRVSVIFIILIAIVSTLFGCVRQQEDVIVSPASTPDAPQDEPESQTPRQKLVFLFFSDTQANPETGDYSDVAEMFCRAVDRAVDLAVDRAADEEEKPELVLFGGDTVNDGGDDLEWSDFWREVGTAFDGLTTAAVAGNHDNNALLTEQFDYPQKQPEDYGMGFFYSLYVDPVFFIMLDSNKMGAANQTDIEWLQNELQSETAQGAAWRVAVMHHPMWPPVDIPKDLQRAETMREHFLPLLEFYGVDLILCGHQHIYSRTAPMSGETESGDDHGIVQVVVASGGKDSYIAGERDFIAAGKAAATYLLLAAYSDNLILAAYDENDEMIDYLELR